MPKLYIGPKGGKYYIKKGKKVYVKTKILYNSFG
jgi:hypothetical protein